MRRSPGGDELSGLLRIEEWPTGVRATRLGTPEDGSVRRTALGRPGDLGAAASRGAAGGSRGGPAMDHCLVVQKSQVFAMP